MSNEGILVPLMTDREIARLIGFSESWVRQQRSNRNQKRAHAFTVDPIYVGDSPRYRRSDVEEWFKGLVANKPYAEEPAQ